MEIDEDKPRGTAKIITAGGAVTVTFDGEMFEIEPGDQDYQAAIVAFNCADQGGVDSICRLIVGSKNSCEALRTMAEVSAV